MSVMATALEAIWAAVKHALTHSWNRKGGPLSSGGLDLTPEMRPGINVRNLDKTGVETRPKASTEISEKDVFLGGNLVRPIIRRPFVGQEIQEMRALTLNQPWASTH